ncbi:MAG TPA: hypothetical protein VKB12_08275, partial [Pyrinomonadaceae bacterium]|nr:hypothetical protein [Pyrinomonadaceae bacterium]
PYFKPGKELKELINEDGDAGGESATAEPPDTGARPAETPDPDATGGREGGGSGGGETTPSV